MYQRSSFLLDYEQSLIFSVIVERESMRENYLEETRREAVIFSLARVLSHSTIPEKNEGTTRTLASYLL